MSPILEFVFVCLQSLLSPNSKRRKQIVLSREKLPVNIGKIGLFVVAVLIAIRDFKTFELLVTQNYIEFTCFLGPG